MTFAFCLIRNASAMHVCMTERLLMKQKQNLTLVLNTIKNAYPNHVYSPGWKCVKQIFPPCYLICKTRWDHFFSNEEVPRREGVQDIELRLVGNRLRCLGRINRMHEKRLVKKPLYCQLLHRFESVGRPNLRYKDTCKDALKGDHT